MDVSARLRTMWDAPPLSSARESIVLRDAALIDSQIAISEIAAPTGEEQERGAWVAARFRELGLSSVHADAAGNVIGTREGAEQQAPVVICAHLDTVFPRTVALRVQRDGPRLLGPGIGDNGRGLAAMLALAGAIDGTALRTRAPVVFVATTGEEGSGDLRGAKALFASEMSHAAAAIALDGAGDERIVHRALGSRRFRVHFCGAGGHSWTAFGVPNAVHAAAITGAMLARIALPLLPRTTLSVGRIGGGISVNAIPDDAWLEIDLRSTSESALRTFETEIRSAATGALQEENLRGVRGTPPLALEITVIGDRPSGETDASLPLVVAAMEATQLIGREPDLATASTDANVPISRGIPAIAIGAGGRGGEAHTLAEWFENSAGHLGVMRAMAIVVAAAGLASQG
ncbi:MAG TPA: M20/M25/M40 family metallo-hydrolase [Gemmatimonadaceae bacterium]|nr:M20/M25/M40 family metallo-hydrolase [Gemmatimonadaceae bacterium]